jgi:hypothetical protein
LAASQEGLSSMSDDDDDDDDDDDNDEGSFKNRRTYCS